MPVLLTLSATLLAQSLPVRNCPPDGLDATVQAFDGPDHGYTLAINLRNASGETCLVDNFPANNGVSPNGGVMLCYYCEEGAKQPLFAQITLTPGESVHQTRTWRTAPVDGSTHCVSPTEMSWDKIGQFQSYFMLFSRSLLKPICSPIVLTSYSAGQFRPDTVAGFAADSPAPVIHWANDENVSYSREHIPLRVTVEDPGQVLSLDEHSCPRLFVRVRDPDPSRPIFSRTTRVDELQDVACKVGPGGASGRGSTFVMGFDASYAITRKDDKGGEYRVDVSALAEIKGSYLLVGNTEDLHLSMVDGRFIRRNWSAAIEGATISLTLDKDAYELSGDIPLHIALGNVDSHATFTSMDPYMDFPGLTLELESSDGQPIPTWFSDMWMMGHGFCHRFVPELVFPLEVTLNGMGFHPNRAGVYSVVAVWRPFKGACPDMFRRRAGSQDAPAEHLTVRSSPVTFRLVPK
jgi:hypothetical protein